MNARRCVRHCATVTGICGPALRSRTWCTTSRQAGSPGEACTQLGGITAGSSIAPRPARRPPSRTAGVASWAERGRRACAAGGAGPPSYTTGLRTPVARRRTTPCRWLALPLGRAGRTAITPPGAVNRLNSSRSESPTANPSATSYCQPLCNELASSSPSTAKPRATSYSFHCHGARNVTTALPRLPIRCASTSSGDNSTARRRGRVSQHTLRDALLTCKPLSQASRYACNGSWLPCRSPLRLSRDRGDKPACYRRVPSANTQESW